jgi:glycosyltransferase involved in cell wall biosynthesis
MAVAQRKEYRFAMGGRATINRSLSFQMLSNRSPQAEGVYVRRSSRTQGLFFDEFANDSAWIRDAASLQFPPLPNLKKVVVRGEGRLHPEVLGLEVGVPELDVFLNHDHIATVAIDSNQSWEVAMEVPPEIAAEGPALRFVLRGVGRTNFLAWLARVGESWPVFGRIQRFRKQNKNRQIRILRVEADGATVFDFSNRSAPYAPAFARENAKLGLNVIGFFTADLGIGESARTMVRAADAAQIPAAAIPLKLPCKARLGDQSFSAFVQDHNPHAVNIFHLDPPASRDIDAHHGAQFREKKYNIGYWAWELMEFPDAWLPSFDYFQEIWCPSEFVRRAIADKSPLPVVTMPHAVEFARPTESMAELRASFGLPLDQFLFLFLYDLNSYTERKNPTATIQAFRQSGLAQKGARLVLKVHGAAGNEGELELLRRSLADLPGTILLSESLSRGRVYALEAACDCFVSLHRSEGFGFAVAECMYLGKPVIATDWSATSEYLNDLNGAPVRYRLATLEKNFGPYAKGQIWAEADPAHAAEWMQRLFADPELRTKLGAAAQRTIQAEFSLKAIGARYRRRLDAIASW